MDTRSIKEKYSHSNFEKDGNAKCYGYDRRRDTFFFQLFEDEDAGCMFSIAKKYISLSKFKGYRFPTYVYFPENEVVLYTCNKQIEQVPIDDMQKFKIHMRSIMNSHGEFIHKLLSFEEIHVMITLNGSHVPFKDNDFQQILDLEKLQLTQQSLDQAMKDCNGTYKEDVSSENDENYSSNGISSDTVSESDSENENKNENESEIHLEPSKKIENTVESKTLSENPFILFSHERSTNGMDLQHFIELGSEKSNMSKR